MNGLTISHVMLTPEAVSAIFQTALDSGVGYWAVLDNVKRRLNGQIYRIELSDVTLLDPKPHALTAVHLTRAIGQMFAQPKQYDVALSQLVSQPTVDGPLADVIVQVAMFGKVVYG